MAWDHKVLEQFEPEVKVLCTLPYSGSQAPEKVIICRNIYSAIYAKAAPQEALAWLDKFVQTGDAIPEIYLLIALLLACCPEAYSQNTAAVINENLAIASEMGSRGQRAAAEYAATIWAAAIASSAPLYSQTLKEALSLQKKADEKSSNAKFSKGTAVVTGLAAASSVRKSALAETREKAVQHGTSAAAFTGLAALQASIAHSEAEAAKGLAHAAGMRMQVNRYIAINLPMFWSAYEEQRSLQGRTERGHRKVEEICANSQSDLIPGIEEMRQYLEKYYKAVKTCSYRALKPLVEEMEAGGDPLSDLKLMSGVARCGDETATTFGERLAREIERMGHCLRRMTVQQVSTRLNFLRGGMAVLVIGSFFLVEPVSPAIFWVAVVLAFGILMIDLHTDVFSIPERKELRTVAREALSDLRNRGVPAPLVGSQST